MKKSARFSAFFLSLLLVLSVSACSPVDKEYGVESSEPATAGSTPVKKADDSISRPAIMSSDRVMSQFVDISVFDEENYAQVYLGKKFKFNVSYAGDEFTVPTTLSALKRKGWEMVEDNLHNEDSLVYACDSVETVFADENGAKISALFYNPSNSSVRLKKCNIVKFKIENNFYSDSENYTEFNVNGLNNKMAITDIIETLGTPSHFYGIAPDNYYLDYFISEDDRRNGITVYINPADDAVTAVEFSYYK